MTIIGQAEVLIKPETGTFAGDLAHGISGALAAIGPVGVAVGAVAAAAVGVGAALVEVGEKFKGAFNTIRVGTGATGTALEGLKADFKATFAAVPATIKEASDAITILNQRTELTGPSLRSLAIEQLNLARITKSDLTTNVTETTKAFANFGIAAKDQGPKLDELFRASQKTGIPIQALAGSLQQFGPILRGLGFNFETSTALLATLNKEGINAGPVFAGLRKAIGAFAKEGKDAPTALKETFDLIRNAKTPIEATQEALKVFGARAGPQLADAIRGGRLAFDELAKAIGKGDTINKAAQDTLTLGQRFAILKNQALTAIEPVASKLLELVEKGLDGLTKAFERVREVLANSKGFQTFRDDLALVAEKLQPLVSLLQDHLQPILIGVAAAALLLAGPFIAIPALLVALYLKFKVVRDIVSDFAAGLQIMARFIVNDVAPVISKFVDFVGEQFGHFSKFVSEELGPFGEAVGHVFNVINAVVQPALDVLSLLVEGTFHAISRVASDVFVPMKDFIGAVFREIGDVVKLAVAVLRDVVKLGLDLINGDWGKAWDALKSIVSDVFEFSRKTGENALRAIGDVFKGALNLFKDLGKSLIGGLKDGVSAAISGIGDFFSKIGDRIYQDVKKGLGPLGKFLSPKSQFGVDLGNGIILGIQDAVSRGGPSLARSAAAITDALRLPNPTAQLAGLGTGINGGGTVIHAPVSIVAHFGPGSNADDLNKGMESAAKKVVDAFARQVTQGRLAGAGTR